ncbi:hypothetical protein VaNZ11_012433 [Volvox africanus]|uniref:Membrane-associated protein n=1 Tax=Volvox africanus TaxID=51714 RepID=A0ABQ5SFX5_9CHLO|nr:hypothetical protein VaNZ11_012433 [Volvox africanus]
MICRCLACFASNAYSCFSKAALTAMAVIKVLVTISIIVIVAVKLEDVSVVVQLPDIHDLQNYSALAAYIQANGARSPAQLSPPAMASPSLIPAPSNLQTDVNVAAGPVHMNASCLLQKRNLPLELESYTRTMCSYVYAVSSISLLATFVMACLLWCTCHLCGWGPIVELAFALLGTAWWLAAALVLQENTTVSVNAKDAIKEIRIGSALPSPSLQPLAMPLPPPSLPLPPSPPIGHDAAAQLAALMQEFTPRSLRQWRQALVGLSWVMMGMFAASSVLLLVEACGCLLDCCSCLCRCCCSERPESRWRANLRKRKRLGGEEYTEMCGGVVSSTNANCSSNGAAPAVMVVARSDEYSMSNNPSSPRAPSRQGWW